MRVAFLHARQDPKYARLMVASVKLHMPGVSVMQWTDEETPVVDGVDNVLRMPWDGENPTIFRMQFLAAGVGDILCIDTDCIVQADLRPVFGLPFDVAFTWRDGPIFDGNKQDITKIMPVNCGVMFSRSAAFWKACLEWCDMHEVKEWCADQLAVPRINGFDVLRLHCVNFNYTPFKQHEDLSKRLVVHYKGDRKAWMC